MRVMKIADAWMRVHEGQTVTFRPRGTSMVGLVADGAEVVVAPARTELLAVGDVVLVRVRGSYYLHKVIALDSRQNRVRIGNNRGGVNGWTPARNAVGLAVSVAGAARPGTSDRVR